ncbi:dual specificity protein phosphatase family protein [Rhizobiales bacterium TNE-4]|nr:dual specificity protein phosphatase family protein [Rhizobiales bacterium TNE-4]MBV1827158.1 dual specificity protein phosphatase family protein [Rhizobiales bacterium TNE-4]
MKPPLAVYRQLDVFGFEAAIDLRDPVEAAGTLPSQAIARLHVPTPDRQPPSQSDLARALAFMDHHRTQDSRMLIHCVHWIGRSAIIALAALVSEGLDPLTALTQAKNRRWKISPRPAQYEAWATWLTVHRKNAGRDYAIPDFDSFARIAYRHLTHCVAP